MRRPERETGALGHVHRERLVNAHRSGHFHPGFLVKTRSWWEHGIDIELGQAGLESEKSACL